MIFAFGIWLKPVLISEFLLRVFASGLYDILRALGLLVLNVLDVSFFEGDFNVNVLYLLFGNYFLLINLSQFQL